MKKVIEKSRVEKIFERLENKPRFLLEIRKTRTLLGIPIDDGFSSDWDQINWATNNKIKPSGDINDFIIKLTGLSSELLKKEKVNIEKLNFWQYIGHYLLFGRKEIKIFGEKTKLPQIKYFNIRMQRIKTLNDDDINYIRNTNPSGVLIMVTPDITKDELLKFVDKEYQNLRILIGRQKPISLKDNHKREEHQKIYRFWKSYSRMTIKKLRSITGQMNYNKSDAVSFILNRDYKIEVRPDNLRTIVSRMKKREDNL